MKSHEPEDDSFPESIEAPTDADVDRIAKLILQARRAIKAELGQDLTKSRQDLQLIQTLLSTRAEVASTGQMPTALGLLMASIFVSENRDFDWWIAVSREVREAVVRFKRTDLLFHPEDFLAKRMDENERIDVPTLYRQLTTRTRAIERASWLVYPVPSWCPAGDVDVITGMMVSTSQIARL